MKKFEFFEHTADIGILAEGKSINEVFENSALALFSLMVKLEDIAEEEQINISVEADDLEELLVEWLNELIYQFETKELLFKRFKVTEIADKGKKLEAKAYGEKIDRLRHKVNAQAKACTYHNLEIKKNKTWKARVVIDV